MNIFHEHDVAREYEYIRYTVDYYNIPYKMGRFRKKWIFRWKMHFQMKNALSDEIWEWIGSNEEKQKSKYALEGKDSEGSILYYKCIWVLEISCDLIKSGQMNDHILCVRLNVIDM